MGSHRHPKGGLLWAQSPLPDFILFFFPSCWVVLSRSGNCSILQVTGLENIKTTLSSLFINISADALCLQLSAVSNRRGQWKPGCSGGLCWIQAALQMGAVQRHMGTGARWLDFGWGWLYRQGLVGLCEWMPAQHLVILKRKSAALYNKWRVITLWSIIVKASSFILRTSVMWLPREVISNQH